MFKRTVTSRVLTVKKRDNHSKYFLKHWKWSIRCKQKNFWSRRFKSWYRFAYFDKVQSRGLKQVSEVQLLSTPLAIKLVLEIDDQPTCIVLELLQS